MAQHGAALDPRTRLSLTLGAILLISLLPLRALWLYPVLYAAILAVGLAARVSPLTLVRRSWVVLPFMLAALPLPFTSPGPHWAAPGGLLLSVPGTLRLIAVFFKAWLSVQVSILLITTTPANQVFWALAALGLPRVLVLVVSFAWRYLDVLRDETRRMLQARASRSAGERGGGLWWRAQVAGQMVASLLIRSIARSERVFAAMESRGDPANPRLLNDARFARRDGLTLALGGVAMLAVLFVAVVGAGW